jgi:hypothetical protein
MLRRFTLSLIALVILSYVVVTHCCSGEMSMERKMELALNTCQVRTYHNRDLGYQVDYPEFFQQMPDSLIGEWGTSVFRYWNQNVSIELSVYLEPNPYGLSPARAMDSIARFLQADEKRCRADSFFISGRVRQNGLPMADARYFAKYVRHQRLWMVQRLVYPAGYDRAVARWVRHVRDWTVWDSPGPSLDWLEKISHNRRKVRRRTLLMQPDSDGNIGKPNCKQK